MRVLILRPGYRSSQTSFQIHCTCSFLMFMLMPGFRSNQFSHTYSFSCTYVYVRVHVWSNQFSHTCSFPVLILYLYTWISLYTIMSAPGTAKGETVLLPLVKNQEFHNSFLFLPRHCPRHPLKASAAQLTRCYHWQLSDSVLILKSRLQEIVPLEQIWHHYRNRKMIAENYISAWRVWTDS